MIIKLLIFGGLAYLVYRAILGPGPARPRDPRVDRAEIRQIDDVMVQDPQCGVYFPQREGVAARVNGEIIHFCSKECMEQYLAQGSGK